MINAPHFEKNPLDVVVLVNEWMASANLSQEPEVVLPYGMADKMPHAPIGCKL